MMSSEIDEAAPFVGAMLRMASQSVRDEITMRVARAGYDDIRSAHVLLFRYPGPDGLRPSDLAARLQLSKQSINDLVRHLEQAGYLTLEPDPEDGRARRVRLTVKGKRLQRSAREAAAAAERRIEEDLGPGRLKELKEMLDVVVRASPVPLDES